MGYSREQRLLEPIVGIRDIPDVLSISQSLPATPGALGIATVPH